MKNIIYMHTHDSGRYWSPYGYALPTPHLMELARQGTLFRQCYCAGPTCSPSRAALLTGMNPHSCGMQGLASRGWQLNDYSRHLAAYLGQNGYETALCGIQHEAPDHRMIGYKQVLGSQEFSMDQTEQSMEEWDFANTRAACAFLQEPHKNIPFFLSMGWFNTHREYPKAKSDIDPAYLAPPLPLYDCEINRRDMADYHESVRVVDDCVGMLLQALEEAGLSDETLVIMTTDHGIAFPQMKCTLYDTGIGVGLILRYPGNPSAGQATDALVSQLDLYPTVCQWAGLPLPAWLEGHSLLPLLEQRCTEVRQEIFAEVTYHAAYEPKRCIRTPRYKLIRFYDEHNGIVPANIDECPSKDLLLQNGFAGHTRVREYLFDLWLDAPERENLAADPGHRAVYADLSRRLEAWMKATDDPLLKYGSRVPKPAGARVNRLTCQNPRLLDFED